jgi:hypothetical protein
MMRVWARGVPQGMCRAIRRRTIKFWLQGTLYSFERHPSCLSYLDILLAMN